MPADTEFVVTASGNERTCAAANFFMMGVFGSMWYNTFLAIYFVLIIRFDWPEHRVAVYVEPIGHTAALGAIRDARAVSREMHEQVVSNRGPFLFAWNPGHTKGQPDALILCHEPTRDHMRGLPEYDLPSLEELRDVALPLARRANPACQVVGISINTQHMSDDEAQAYLAEVEARMGLVTDDPYRNGAGRLVDALTAA